MVADDAIGIGISLATGYGTIALRYDNGSYRNIGRIDGDHTYLETMQRLSLPSSIHLCPPYRNLDKYWNNIPRELWRSLRKRLGIAASSEVLALSRVIGDLYNAALSHLPKSDQIRSVVVSYPALPALCDEDIVDSIQHLNLKALYSQHINQPREVVAASAGYGIGLCKSYQDYNACRSEGLQMPYVTTLLVEYTRISLAVHASGIREAIELAWRDILTTVRFDLGGDQRTADVASYDDRVRHVILSLLREMYKNSKPPKTVRVIMTGECAGDVAVQKLVKAVVGEFSTVTEILTSQPEYITARGAVELAWRALKLGILYNT